jgi:hypothetical protein
MKKIIRAVGLAIARGFGTRLVDCKTGRIIGRALLIPWRGKIHVIGLETKVVPVFLPQKRLTYWKQELGFITHDPPDFDNLRQPGQMAPDPRPSKDMIGIGERGMDAAK